MILKCNLNFIIKCLFYVVFVDFMNRMGMFVGDGVCKLNNCLD